MRLSLCVAGCGRYARTVLQDIHDMTDDLELFFASRDINKARQYCEEFGGTGFFGSYEEAAADPRVKAMYFATPHDLHLENTLLAANNGKHILVEKPIARNLAESIQMIQAARKAEVKLMVAENVRFFPVVQQSKAVIDEGTIGQPRLIQIQAERLRPYAGWRTSKEVMGGGVFIDGGIHFVDMMVCFGGFPERVYAVKPPQVLLDMEGEDSIVMVANLPSGGVGLINFSEGSPIKGMRRKISVTGTRGHLDFDLFGTELSIETPESSRTVRVPDARNGARGMVSEFRNSIIEDREPSMSGHEALSDLVVVLGAYRSSEEGRAVSLSLPKADAG
jgi:predicted dehydrogenase